MILKALISFILLFSVGVLANGDNFDLIQDIAAQDHANPELGLFISPNEYYPHLLAPALATMPAGAYLSLGTERAFISAGLSPAVHQLVLVDYNPATYLYNRINTSLIKVAKDLEQFVKLKYENSHYEWEKIILASNLTPTEKVFLLKKANFIFFTTLVRLDKKGLLWMRTPKATGGSFPLEPFHQANYMRYPEQFARVKALADQNKILIFRANISNFQQMLQLRNYLTEKNIKIAACDFSNAWVEDYTGPNSILPALKVLQNLLNDHTKIILTKRMSDKWNYFVFDRKDLVFFMSNTSPDNNNQLKSDAKIEDRPNARFPTIHSDYEALLYEIAQLEKQDVKFNSIGNLYQSELPKQICSTLLSN